jgi:hypothetical protein
MRVPVTELMVRIWPDHPRCRKLSQIFVREDPPWFKTGLLKRLKLLRNTFCPFPRASDSACIKKQIGQWKRNSHPLSKDAVEFESKPVGFASRIHKDFDSAMLTVGRGNSGDKGEGTVVTMERERL